MTKKTTQHDELLQQLADMETNWKRALADYHNLEKRTKDQQQAMAQLACLAIIEKLLPILDHLEMAAKHFNDSGLNMIVKQFTDVFDTEGVSQIEALDQIFDPTTMECAEQVEGEANRVVEVVSRGYMIGNRVIRPAKVKVGRGNKF